ncbi:transposase [Chromobacterium sp. ATCC 53434]|uniref:REP-associated tyrosine transposase n=1 Tax=Chromobacterium sp. (strain ATCC 53434 / SC 14030) TaxID=2059672 RepID=UPI000C776BCA|nr:transposase [Chromobacterium sp. ATCC 53434]AUH52644.1 transposase [Chromobacterium sp. ATCC 53434]
MSHYRRASMAGGAYFFTVVLAQRGSGLLVREVDRLRSVYRRVWQARPFETVAICILPDHLHAIWQLPIDDGDYAARWSLIKSGFSRGLPQAAARSASKVAHRDKGIWQRRYWEHQIRDDDDMRRHVDYIHGNPLKHGLVAQLKDWPYSSFHAWVRDGRLPPDWAGKAERGGFGE